MENLMEAKNVTKRFSLGSLINKKYVTAVDNFSFEIQEDKQVITTLAGESGSGKTTITNLLLGFIKPTSGEILYRGKNVWKLKGDEKRIFRREVQAIFQDPYETLNPFYKMNHVLVEPIKKFKLASSQGEAEKMAKEALLQVGLNPEEVLDKYPHQLSGGQRQRVILARAFTLRPKIFLV